MIISTPQLPLQQVTPNHLHKNSYRPPLEPCPDEAENEGFRGLLGTENPKVNAFATMDADAGAHDPFGSFTFTGVGQTSFVSEPSAFLKTVSFGP